MRDMESLADRYLDARNARRAARDNLFVAFGRLIEKHGNVATTIEAVTKMIDSHGLVDFKPLAKAFAGTDYPVDPLTRFGKAVAEARTPKRRKKANDDGQEP
jgi:hypothetical protein